MSISSITLFPSLAPNPEANTSSVDQSAQNALRFFQNLIDIKSIEEMEAIETLDLSYKGIKDEDLIHIQHLKGLKTLKLYFNNIGDEGAKALAANTTLETLYLNSNQIGDKGAQALAANTTLETLYLHSNQIKDEGAKALAANTTLETLYLYSNLIGDEGANAFRIALVNNENLCTLNLGNIKEEINTEIEEFLKRNRYNKIMKNMTLFTGLYIHNFILCKRNFLDV